MNLLPEQGSPSLYAVVLVDNCMVFSHKSYVVIPRDSLEEDIARLDALCRIFGAGLILFDKISPETPNFEIMVRVTKHEPDEIC